MKSRQILFLTVLMTMFSAFGVSGALAQGPTLFSEVIIKDAGFAEKFKYSIDVHAKAVSIEGSDVFELGSTQLIIEFNPAVLSADPASALSEQHPSFHNGIYQAMSLSTFVDPYGTYVVLHIQPEDQSSGATLPFDEVWLARITFDILHDEEQYRVIESDFELTMESTMLAIGEAEQVWILGKGLPPQLENLSFRCTPIISEIQSPRIANVNQLFLFEPEASACINADPLKFDYTGLPAWAAFDEDTGIVTGTPTDGDLEAGYRIEVLATDFYGDFYQSNFSINVGCPSEPLTISNDPATKISVGAPYVFQPIVQNACGTYTFSDGGTLQDWLALNQDTGLLAGIPEAEDVGTTPLITISVEDQHGNSDAIEFTIEVTKASKSSGGGGGCFISSMWK